MLTLNTNLTGLITQSSLKSSTNRLNQAIEQMTSGFKINHAKDNAANYSISTNMSTKISAYQIAEENVNMGLDLLSTANDILSSMQDKAARLSALSTQARNGTYGASSLAAINAEANAIITELMRDYNNAEYNKISLFNNTTAGSGGGGSGGGGAAPTAGETGFINESGISDAYKAGTSKFLVDVTEETPQVIVNNPTQLASAINSYAKIGIANAETLAELANIVNSGTDCLGKTIILTDDIDLSAYSNWQPIGTDSNRFRGTFNGNGHVVRNLTINRSTEDYVGLFGYSYYYLASFVNVGLENVKVNGNARVGGLVGQCAGGIKNCYSEGTVTSGDSYAGGLVGYSGSNIQYSYSDSDVTGGRAMVGGLTGYVNLEVINCYATGNVRGQGINVAGLVGQVFGSAINCYATGNVISTGNEAGGLVGSCGHDIIDSYTTGDVTSNGNHIGGLVGQSADGNITGCYSTGNVSGKQYVGGLIGYIFKRSGTISITNSSSIGTATGNKAVGSFIGGILDSDDTNTAIINISDCYTYTKSGSIIGGAFKAVAGVPTEYESPAMSDWLDGITIMSEPIIGAQPAITVLQIGINGGDTSRLGFYTNFQFNFATLKKGMEKESTFDAIQALNALLSAKQTDLGAVQNRLESALEEIATNYDNLVSSRSTLRDADIANVSAKYIQQQILQQASATLMATANQTPAIALQLI